MITQSVFNGSVRGDQKNAQKTNYMTDRIATKTVKGNLQYLGFLIIGSIMIFVVTGYLIERYRKTTEDIFKDMKQLFPAFS